MYLLSINVLLCQILVQIQSCPFIMLCIRSIGDHAFISESCYKGAILQRNFMGYKGKILQRNFMGYKEEF